MHAHKDKRWRIDEVRDKDTSTWTQTRENDRDSDKITTCSRTEKPRGPRPRLPDHEELHVLRQACMQIHCIAGLIQISNSCLHHLTKLLNFSLFHRYLSNNNFCCNVSLQWIKSYETCVDKEPAPNCSVGFPAIYDMNDNVTDDCHCHSCKLHFLSTWQDNVLITLCMSTSA